MTDYGAPELFGVKPNPKFKKISKNGLITLDFGVEMAFGDEIVSDINSLNRRL